MLAAQPDGLDVFLQQLLLSGRGHAGQVEPVVSTVLSRPGPVGLQVKNISLFKDPFYDFVQVIYFYL